MGRMRRPDAVLILSIVVLTLVGCGTAQQNARTGSVRKIQQVAQVYDVHDGRDSRKRTKFLQVLGMAVDRLRQGALDEAEANARAALKLEPRLPDAYTVLATIAGQRGQADEAGRLYRQAAEMAPAEGAVLNNYGVWLCSNGYPAEALVWFDRALAAPGYPSPAAALANAGDCAMEAGQVERAVLDLRRALELDPADSVALEAMARLEFDAGRFFEARAFSQRRLAAAPASRSVLQLAVHIEDRLGDKAAASRYQQRLRQEFPEDAAMRARD